MKNEKSSIQSTCAALGIFLLLLAAVIVYLAMYSKSNEKVNYVQNRKTPTTQSLAFLRCHLLGGYQARNGHDEIFTEGWHRRKRCCVDM